MKKLAILLTVIFGTAVQSQANGFGFATINSYADAIVFDEMGITFSVYPDGEFDFYVQEVCGPLVAGNGAVQVTFNSGYDYSPYVQYDDYGAVIQVENVPVYYDYYGRVSQIGDVSITYRNRRVCRVGGLYIYYNSYGHYAYHTGYINVWNPCFVYRPFYVAFVRPVVNLCLVRPTPYRQYYRPMRYTYYRPYVHNPRPCYATIGHTYRPASGYGRVHGRYAQTAARGERPVMRERRTVTAASVNAPNTVSNIRNTNKPVRNDVNGYERTRTANTRQTAPRSGQVSSSARKPATSTQQRNTGQRAVQNTTRSSSPVARPNTIVNRSRQPDRNSTTTSRNGSVNRSNSTRSVTSGTRGNTHSVSSNDQGSNRTVQRSSARSGNAVKAVSSSRRPSVSTRGVQNTSSKGSTGTVRTGSPTSGKVSVAGRSSKGGR